MRVGGEMSSPEVPSSSIEDAQQARVILDAVVQAGLTARIAFSLVGGLAGRAYGSEDEELARLAQEAQQAAEEAKNADMSLDMALTGDGVDAVEALGQASRALARASEAFEVAGDVIGRLEEGNAGE